MPARSLPFVHSIGLLGATHAEITSGKVGPRICVLGTSLLETITVLRPTARLTADKDLGMIFAGNLGRLYQPQTENDALVRYPDSRHISFRVAWGRALQTQIGSCP
ncbi:hypothetical protein N656DRAFT_118694 [Canariomyces notabilis]|uniref:Uncharacterized protein n=1 Tax=Canariomyces notabilis TaxID=2074819 RepID=A0AAN6TD92_9PEZI|nr:hypothetical protein N656DRAFT_118694 [Canariomyces arenarius]